MNIIPIYRKGHTDAPMLYIVSERLSADEIKNIIDTKYNGRFSDITDDEFREIFPDCRYKFPQSVEKCAIYCEW